MLVDRFSRILLIVSNNHVNYRSPKLELVWVNYLYSITELFVSGQLHHSKNLKFIFNLLLIPLTSFTRSRKASRTPRF